MTYFDGAYFDAGYFAAESPPIAFGLLSDPPYFDDAYFDPTFFNTDHTEAETTGRSARVMRPRPPVIARIVDPDADEAYLGVI